MGVHSVGLDASNGTFGGDDVFDDEPAPRPSGGSPSARSLRVMGVSMRRAFTAPGDALHGCGAKGSSGQFRDPDAPSFDSLSASLRQRPSAEQQVVLSALAESTFARLVAVVH
jgi:hypothetical protein